jgi:hypothetical protein
LPALAGLQSDRPYQFPIKPGQQNFLSGTMGELRSTHFHGGIDIKTDGVEGLPVYAAAGGYVSRIKVEGGGYGHALYIAHPELGTSTVYGHLQRFAPQLAGFVLDEQYRRRQFAVDLYLAPGQFPVTRGEPIGWSGNSGSSGGPHLHFEIRDGDQRPMNPLQYRFSEVSDNIPPVVERIALQTLDAHSRVNGQFGFFEYTPLRSGGIYTLPGVLEVYGTLGVLIQTHDKLNGSANRTGVPRIRMKLDGRDISSIEIDRVPFDMNRDILVYRDHARFRRGNRSYQKLYREPGIRLGIFQNLRDEGRVVIADTLRHLVEIELEDAYSNKTLVRLQLAGRRPVPGEKIQDRYAQPWRQKVEGHTLMMMTREQPEAPAARVFHQRLVHLLPAAYHLNEYAVYLWDLRAGIPDSVAFSSQMLYPDIDMMVPSGVKFSYYTPRMELVFERNSLFDTLFLKTGHIGELEDNREYFEIGEEIIPLRGPVKALLKPEKTYFPKQKTSVYLTADHLNFSWSGGTWRGEAVEFSTRSLGTYTLITDTLPPNVRILQQSSDHFRFLATDNLSGVKDANLHIGGKWVLLIADPKNNLYTAAADRSGAAFQGNIELIVLDQVNNEFVYRSKIN